jgi:hypothetical protein
MADHPQSAPGHGTEEHAHPTWSTYWKVATILTIITLVEVWVYYIPAFVATKLFVHVLYLVGFRNRVSVMFDWAWAYVTYQRGARVIFPMRDVREPEAAAPSERAAS